MRITKRSPFSGKEHTRDILGVTQERLDRWHGGEMIQNVFPELSADDREFMMTGITPEEWEESIGP